MRRALEDAHGGEVRCGFYCDESGNTGVHWADPDQPIFVHGGWLVPNRSVGEIGLHIDELRRRHRLTAPELKWSHIGRRKSSIAIFQAFFEVMLDHSSLPFFWVMDKEFITSAKIVETFFDPAYNEQLPIGMTGAFDLKKELAETVGESSELSQRFAELLRAKGRSNRDHVRDFTSRLADHLASGGEPVLAETLRHFSDSAISEIQDEFNPDTWMRTTVGHSLPGLAQLLEGFMRRRPVELEIVHDNLVRHDAAFDQIRQMFRASEGTDVTMIGGRPRFHSMPTVTSLRLADSKSEPMIQQADLLCGFVRNAFTTIKSGHELGLDAAKICLHLAMFRDEFLTWDANMPRRMWQDFAHQTIGSAARGELDFSL